MKVKVTVELRDDQGILLETGDNIYIEYKSCDGAYAKITYIAPDWIEIEVEEDGTYVYPEVDYCDITCLEYQDGEDE